MKIFHNGPGRASFAIVKNKDCTYNIAFSFAHPRDQYTKKKARSTLEGRISQGKTISFGYAGDKNKVFVRLCDIFRTLTGTNPTSHIRVAQVKAAFEYEMRRLISENAEATKCTT